MKKEKYPSNVVQIKVQYWKKMMNKVGTCITFQSKYFNNELSIRFRKLFFLQCLFNAIIFYNS